ncbi:hypothetical protein D3C75_760880 [compost metagenome]
MDQETAEPRACHRASSHKSAHQSQRPPPLLFGEHGNDKRHIGGLIHRGTYPLNYPESQQQHCIRGQCTAERSQGERE